MQHRTAETTGEDVPYHVLDKDFLARIPCTWVMNENHRRKIISKLDLIRTNNFSSKGTGMKMKGQLMSGRK